MKEKQRFTLIVTWRSALFVFALSSMMVTSGCSDSRPERVPVSGVVLIDGKPLTSGYIQFTPPDSRPAKATLDADGRFSLSTFKPGDGCVLGTHVVTVNAADAVDDLTLRWNAPKKYAVATTSGITKTIDGPVDAMKIELTWGGRPGPIIEKQN